MIIWIYGDEGNARDNKERPHIAILLANTKLRSIYLAVGNFLFPNPFTSQYLTKQYPSFIHNIAYHRVITDRVIPSLQILFENRWLLPMKLVYMSLLAVT